MKYSALDTYRARILWRLQRATEETIAVQNGSIAAFNRRSELENEPTSTRIRPSKSLLFQPCYLDPPEIVVSRITSQFLLFGLLVPLAMIAIGVGAFVVMGKQKPKQAAVEGKDTVSKLRKLPIVSIGVVDGTGALESLDISISGAVVPFRQINLAAEVAGRVRKKSDNCQIGRFVKKGEVLFELDPTDFELEIERLEAMTDSEQAQQRELDQEIVNAKSSLKLAEEELSLHEKEVQRMQSLAKGFASETELDLARRQRIASATQRQTVQNQLQMLETRRTRLKLAERLATAQLQQARVNMERTKIASPLDGVIITESVQADSFVQRGATLCVIEDTQRVEVSCNLRTDQLLMILEQRAMNNSTESPLTNSVASYELPTTPVTVSYKVAGREEIIYEWKGHLSRYEGVGLDSQSRTVPVRIRVDNPLEVFKDGNQVKEGSGRGLPALVRGMFVECKIHTKTPANTVLIPKLALKPGNQVWKFTRDDSLIASEEVVAQDPQPLSSQDSGAKPAKITQVSINPAEWTAGSLTVLSNIKVLNLITLGPNKQEYWIAESTGGIAVGDQVIVSPLASVRGDGTDKVRYQSSQLSGQNAAKE